MDECGKVPVVVMDGKEWEQAFITFPDGDNREFKCMKEAGHPGVWHKAKIYRPGESIRYSWKEKKNV